MTEITIEHSALESMEGLLGEQFGDTLDFCCAEFERLSSEVLVALGNDKEAATRHAHSLKSNAAQFGAQSLAEVARDIEQSLVVDNLAQAQNAASSLDEQVKGSKEQLLQWLAQR
ncbi:Hpt domain-containing protein [Pseudoalteromonas sp. MMG010]|uniref:Hpt domain-containing protein n=1 Tax=Pseudoalteromonas sp. MMG010 TaxID=2822685 RepID=UPI001B39D4EB|nr:Hpt domain-containing protein [Pseudoalteromonas sp. MMG010]MBQ4832576.1 Hpt domain-containing protein [Pseudoalteromonas sp. MMG010]